MQKTSIVLTGFSGSGKSAIAKKVASFLKWDFVDTDTEITKIIGKPIFEFFRQEGEEAFREIEREIVEKIYRRKRIVVATGGGTIVDQQNRELLEQNGLFVLLEARPETILKRLLSEEATSSGTKMRPLLSGDNQLDRIKQIKATRQPFYATADWTIHTDALSTEQVVQEVIRAWQLFGSSFIDDDISEDIACEVRTGERAYPIFVGHGLLNKLGSMLKGKGLDGSVYIISDDNVFPIYGRAVENTLKQAGFSVQSLVFAAGEETKSFVSAIKAYDFLIQQHVERTDTIVALGGGMIGDLAGFIAATCLRGLPWVQVSTSLAAMVDASIGGKVAVNHRNGKNLIGAFYQPWFVLSDIQTLSTLPRREFLSGWAEVIKYGLIKDRDFFEFLEFNATSLMEIKQGPVIEAIRHSAAIKAQIVNDDEKEQGTRVILNYGHTLAHGLETASCYNQFLHGEAVSIGMTGAAMLSQRLKLLSHDIVKRQENILKNFQLPTSFTGVDIPEITKAIEMDKKNKQGSVRWVLLEDIGKPFIHNELSTQDVADVLEKLKCK